MKVIGKGADVVNNLVGDLTLLDATILKYQIETVDYLLQISIVFQLVRRSTADVMVLLIFKDVMEYCFYHNQQHSFYNVENLKLLEVDEKFYFSSDPYHTSGISENDNDFVLSKQLEAYQI